MNTKQLSAREVEHILVSALESGLANYQEFEGWRCISNALQHLRALAAARESGRRDPDLPLDEWEGQASAQGARESAWTDSQMVRDPSSLRREPFKMLIALHVWTADGRIVGMWHHPKREWIDAKEKQMRAMGEGLGWAFERLTLANSETGSNSEAGDR